ncbi:hypothetical protein VNO78_22438 [Psophocarpus tetragonolobus]|uniref:Uncharacterized protein n=1 Tax=Psophocarpus tetragonolobus TaxID=3891 RepID=A0AAN9S2C6_PSOTE
MANHVGFNFNLIKSLAVVDSNDATNHLRHDNHVAEMGAHWLRLLPFSIASIKHKYGFAELLDQGHWLSCETFLEPSTSTSTEQLHQFISGHVQKGFVLHRWGGLGDMHGGVAVTRGLLGERNMVFCIFRMCQ